MHQKGGRPKTQSGDTCATGVVVTAVSGWAVSGSAACFCGVVAMAFWHWRYGLDSVLCFFDCVFCVGRVSVFFVRV